MKAILISSLLLVSAAWAGAPEVPDFSFELKADQLTLTPPIGHHFNTEAPMSITAGKVILKPDATESQITARLSRLALAAKEVSASVYVCDNAKTYCLKKTEKFPLKAAASPSSFILNDSKAAFALAKKKHLPLMIDFFGIWCPPCNHLDALVFHDEKFLKEAEAKIVRLQMDSDRPSAKALMKRYAIRAFPTVVFTTPRGDELFRVLGFRDSTQFQKLVRDAYQDRDQGFDALVKRAHGGDHEAATRAAQIAIDNEKPEEALELLKGLPASELQFKAQRALARKNKNDEGEGKVIRDWLKAFPGTVEAVSLYADLADIEDGLKHEDAKRQALRDGAATAEKYLKTPPARFWTDTDFTEADLKEALGDFYDQLGEKDKAKAAYRACAEAYAAEGREEKSDFPRGPNLERSYCLYQMGALDEAETIAREGIRRYPEEYTFHANLARLLLRQRKDAKAALPEARAAFDTAYGSQRARAALLEAEASEALGEKTAIQKALRDLDSEIRADFSPKRTEEMKKRKAALEKKLTTQSS